MFKKWQTALANSSMASKGRNRRKDGVGGPEDKECRYSVGPGRPP